MSEMNKILLATPDQKKATSPTFPQFLMKSPKNMHKNGKDSKKTSELVFDLGQKSQFWAIYLSKARGKYGKIEFSGLNQKRALIFF